MTLTDVLAVRQTEAWSNYMALLSRLLEDPAGFADAQGGGRAVATAYVDVAREAASVISTRRSSALAARWTPIVEIAIEIGTAVVTIVGGDSPVVRIGGALGGVGRRLAPFVVRLIVRGADLRGEARLESSYELIRGQLPDARERFEQFSARIAETNWLEKADRPIKSAAATINSEP
jgi:hypothetical protein